ncbi:MAG: AI-2E family transporter [Alphaproteobacteria bacterium]|nr:AI-2E family transporter [Alphaproteobacteria bacterium]
MSFSRPALFWLAVIAAAGLLLWAISAVLLPFVAGLAIAYLLDPLADRLQRLGCGRTLATLLILGGAALAVLAIMVVAAPLLQAQLLAFIERLPDYVAALRATAEALVHRVGERVDPASAERLRAAVGNLVGSGAGWLAGLAGDVFRGGVALLNLLSLLFITPIVAFYLLRDWDRIAGTVDGLLPRAYAATIRRLLTEIDSRLAGFVRGQLMVAAMLAAWYGGGLTVAGLEFGLIVGLAAGALSIIPFVGSIGGFVVAVALALVQFDSLVPVAIVAAVIVVGQVAEGNFLTPRLVGERVGLHPVWVIFALLAGGALLGLLGMLLAVPVAATVAVLVCYGCERYRASELYTGSDAGGNGA